MAGHFKQMKVGKCQMLTILLIIFLAGLINCRKKIQESGKKYISTERIDFDKVLYDGEFRKCKELKEIHGAWVTTGKRKASVCICVISFPEILEGCGQDSPFGIRVKKVEKKNENYKILYHTFTDGEDGIKPTYLYIKKNERKLYYGFGEKNLNEFEFYDAKNIPKWDAAKREFILTK